MAAEGKKTKALLKQTRKAAETILENVEKGRGILVISHMDADGLSAAGLMGVALARINAAFRVRIERWFDENVAQEIASEKDCLAVLTDMGSGYLEVLNKEMKGRPLVILDHHPPNQESDEAFTHVNPHLSGIDGTRDLSGAGTTYLTAKALSDGNTDLAWLGVVGALGDLQDKNDERRLGGVNSLIVEDAVKAGCLQVETDLLFFGRETRPIHKALAYTTNPYIPGISGEEDKSLAFLMGLGIKPKKGDKWRALRDLSQDEKRKVFSALSDYLTSRGYKSDTAMSLLGAVYVLGREEPWTPLRDAREFALLLNATGRTGKPGLGVAICMGDRGRCLEEANEALGEYRRTITKYLRWLDEHPDRIEEMGSIYVVHGGQTIDEKVVSAISTILSTNMPNMEKPVIAYSVIPEENLIKISARTVETLTRRGFNLGEILRTAAEKFSGNGGGHNVAAGAQVPLEERERFLKHFDECVREDLQRLKESGS
ncbi:MAG: DHH family phosphoesterase [Candidatus Bathyarchaeota archaeon]|nr:DHH family phosphoesterase [Candidatus Bathyarchaeota archaeon]